MKLLIDRIRVYSLYFLEYIRYGEWESLIMAFVYMATRKSFAKGKLRKSKMGVFETRPNTLDFQYINYAYEIEIKHFVENSQFDVFLDIGACLGEYSVWIAKMGKRAFAFEPVKSSYEMIQKNIRLNQLENKVIAYPIGLGAGHSIEFFQLNATNPGASKRVDEATDQTEKFEINSLDNVYAAMNLKQEDRILIKIDVEGMEVMMLEGAKNFFKTFDHITLIIEEKLSGEGSIRKKLSEICDFEFGTIDRFNIYARKI